MEVLEKIFGSSAKVRIMRIFLFNPQTPFDIEDISKKSKIPSNKTRKEVNNLFKIGLIKKRGFTKDFSLKKKGRRKIVRKRVAGWILDDKFPFLVPLQNFLIHIPPTQYQEIFEKIRKIGSIKLFIVSGVFINDWDSRVDILIVGDKIKRGIINQVMSDIESEIGKDLRYAVFDTSEFFYRLGVCDKLVRDILDYPHKKVLNKLENI